MILSAPKGQRLVGAMIEYPKGSAPVPVSAPRLASMTGILGSGSNLNNIREYKFRVNDFATEVGLPPGSELPGYSSAGYSAGREAIRLHLEMKSDCESDLMNTYYRASVVGRTLCGDRATNDSTAISEVQLRFSPSAMFEVTIPAFKSGVDAFNEIKTVDTIRINMRKYFGTGNLTNLDSVTITVPDMINVLPGGVVKASSSDLPSLTGTVIPVVGNTTSSGQRKIKTLLPHAQLNAAGSGGFNINFTIEIPVEYTSGRPHIISNPLDSIMVEVTDQERLHHTCLYQTFVIGEAQKTFAMLTANYNPYSAYIGEPTAVRIITSGFTGDWYRAAVGGIAISTTNTLSFVPTYIPASGDTTFYVSTIISGDNYGRVPVLVKIDTLPYRNKDASLLLSPPFNHNGTYANPVSILFSEKIKYTVKMVNASHKAGTVVLTDTLPAYMEYAGNASPSTGFTVTTIPGTPTRDVLKWVIPATNPFDTLTVSYEATPASGVCASQPLFINQAWLFTSDSLVNFTTKNRTYHQGAGISITTFSAELGGKIYNAIEQAVDFRSSPAQGIVIVPDEGYRFAGWSHDRYTSLRGEMIEAQEGIMHYDTLTVHGDVELRASFVPIEESIDSEEEEEVVAKAAETAAETADKVWSVKDELNVRTIKAGSIVRIYTMDGILYEQYTTTTSDVTTRKLLRGIYVVTINNGIGVKAVIGD